MSIGDRLVEDLKTAMRAGDSERRDVIRLVRSALKNREIEIGQPLDDDDEIEVIQAQIKQRRDSIDAFESAGRDDLAVTERRELEILLDYLPAEHKPLDTADLEALVDEKIVELDLTGPADMRLLMPALIQATAGRADNRELSTLASTALRNRAADTSE